MNVPSYHCPVTAASVLKYKIPQIVTLTQIYPSGFYIDPSADPKMWGKFKQKKKLSIELSNT